MLYLVFVRLVGWMALLAAVTEANREAWEAASQIG
jgi:hypothetical protein